MTDDWKTFEKNNPKFTLNSFVYERKRNMFSLYLKN